MNTPVQSDWFQKTTDFIRVFPSMVLTLLRIPIYTAIIFGIGCLSFLVIMFIWRGTAWVFLHWLANPW